MATSLDATRDGVRCDLCPSNQFLKSPAELHCKGCHINLCEGCVGQHLLSKTSGTHDIVEYKYKDINPKFSECQTHPGGKCELQCELCHVPVCATCIAVSHQDHRVIEISALTDSNFTNIIQNNEEFEKVIATDNEKQHSELKTKMSEKSQKNDKIISEVIFTVNTGTKYLSRMSCVNSDEVWISGDDTTIKRVNIRGKLLQKVTNVCGSKYPDGLSVTGNGAVLFCDPCIRSVKMMQAKKIHTVITLQGWKPLAVCSSSSGNILVLMEQDRNVKLVRYSGSKVKQEIQHDHDGQPLFSQSKYLARYIEENKNQDICVTQINDIVVVNKFGQFRFKYDGKHPASTFTAFVPYGIATDSKCQILVADHENKCVHVIDKDGQFLFQIDSCDLDTPVPVSVDSQDRLWVGSFSSGEIKVIKYMK